MTNSITSSSPDQSWLGLIPFQWLRNFINHIEVSNPKIARFICLFIPASCPFERTIKFFGKTLFIIPPLCHFNPFYDELMALRFRALVFLSEH